MSIMVKKLYKNGQFLYKMKLIAGNDGMSNLVNWVHIIEDDDVTKFLHGSELVFTAGILNKGGEWLLNFTKRLYEVGTSAFVVNIGPHTKSIPQEVIKFCDEVKMPLFTIPWETRMVDMTRDFCRRIMNNEQAENNIATTMKNIVFNIGDIEAQVDQMERNGYRRDNYFCFAAIQVSNGKNLSVDNLLTRLGKLAESIAKRTKDLFIEFSYKDFLILVMVNYSEDEIRNFMFEFIENTIPFQNEWDVHVGVSSNQMGVINQKSNFEKALSAMEMAKKRGIPHCFYEELGIYKLLYAVEDKTVLRSFCNDVTGKLITYDRENSTNLMDMLVTYLQNNSSLQIVAEKQYVHRNTVTNQLKKIEEITGYNPFELEDKVKLCLALYIRAIL